MMKGRKHNILVFVLGATFVVSLFMFSLKGTKSAIVTDDAKALIKYIINGSNPDILDDNLVSGDINQDGLIKMNDVMLLLKDYILQ